MHHKRKDISRAELKENVTYDPETGSFYSRNSRGKIKEGSLLGYPPTRNGYSIFQINKKRILAHRLAYLYVHGWVPHIIDHINGDCSDNRISNLRPSDIQTNTWNTAKRKNAKSRFKGPVRKKNSYQAVIRNGKSGQVYLGSFKTEIEAAYRYDLASLQYHGDMGRRNFLPLVW